MDLNTLHLIYRNTETEEELEGSLQFHNISKKDFFTLVEEQGWRSNPFIDSILLGRNDPESRIKSLFDYTADKIQRNASSLPIDEMVSALDSLVKIKEKINKLDEEKAVKDMMSIFDTLPDEEKKDIIMAKELFKKAMGPGSSSIPAIIYWMRAHAKWKESEGEGGMSFEELLRDIANKMPV